MDYKTFSEIIGEEMDMPNDEQTIRLIEGDNTIHLQLRIGYRLENDGGFVPIDNLPMADQLLKGLDVLRGRGAKRGEDYIMTCHSKRGMVFISIHSTNGFLCEEDFDVPVTRENG